MNVSFTLDSDWKVGFIGRNGKGKTTLLNLLIGKYKYQGVIKSSISFDYFPYEIDEKQTNQNCVDFIDELKHGCELWKVMRELAKLHVEDEVLYRPFRTLSYGERTKVMLAILFSSNDEFLLIDEPTNHLDQEARTIVKEYLRRKKGFILVSHDRDLLDACVDHVLVLNRQTIEVQSGNYTSWSINKERKDKFSKMENEKHRKEIQKLKNAYERSKRWAEKSENKKIGFDPIKEHDRSVDTRAFIGSKTKKMQNHVKQYENRIQKNIAEKEGLLQDIEEPIDLQMRPMIHHHELLIHAREYTASYSGRKDAVLKHLNFDLRVGERIFLHGKNGCGKSTFIKAILSHSKDDLQYYNEKNNIIQEQGELSIASKLVISYVSQDTSHLSGELKQYCENMNLNESLFIAILNQLGVEHEKLAMKMEDYSEGQKKKILVATSLMTPAHLYIWDEPLNYVDIFTRIQIEKVILEHQPTMLIVDHDIKFQEKIATRVVEIG